MIGLTQNPLKKGLTQDFGTQAIDKIWLLNAPLSKKCITSMKSFPCVSFHSSMD